ncbi:T-complex protein 1 subunit gamma [Orobanche minor]
MAAIIGCCSIKSTNRDIWDSYTVKAQAFKTAIEAACMLLRIDDIDQEEAGPWYKPGSIEASN